MLRPTRETLRVRVLVGLLAAGVVLVLGACTSPPVSAPSAAVAVPAQQHEAAYPNVERLSDLSYGTADGQNLRLDVCLPPEAASTGRPAIVGVHGGSWRSGDKANESWIGICRWLASEGYVTVSVNYRLAPVYTFPAQIVDVRQVVRWLRDPAQVARYGIDPARIGAIGGSAGGNLVALLGTEGSGAVDVGTRVAAVVDLSGPVDLTAAGAATSGFQQTQLSYLGCASYAQLPRRARRVAGVPGGCDGSAVLRRALNARVHPAGPGDRVRGGLAGARRGDHLRHGTGHQARGGHAR